LVRLGSAGGAQEVRAHRFFHGVDWEALLRREVVPPFNPCRRPSNAGTDGCGEDKGSDVRYGDRDRNRDVDNDLHVGIDTENFEQEFTRLPLHSIDEGQEEEVGQGQANDHFKNLDTHGFPFRSGQASQNATGAVGLAVSNKANHESAAIFVDARCCHHPSAAAAAASDMFVNFSFQPELYMDSLHDQLAN
jgi:hypothetical protein